jgi:hypothetical protein
MADASHDADGPQRLASRAYRDGRWVFAQRGERLSSGTAAGRKLAQTVREHVARERQLLSHQFALARIDLRD